MKSKMRWCSAELLVAEATTYNVLSEQPESTSPDALIYAQYR